MYSVAKYSSWGGLVKDGGGDSEDGPVGSLEGMMGFLPNEMMLGPIEGKLLCYCDLHLKEGDEGAEERR